MSDQLIGRGDHQPAAVLDFTHGEGIDLHYQQVEKTHEPCLSLYLAWLRFILVDSRNEPLEGCEIVQVLHG